MQNVISIPDSEGVDNIVIRKDKDEWGEVLLIEQGGDSIHLPVGQIDEFIKSFSAVAGNG